MKVVVCEGLVLPDWHETPVLEELKVGPPGPGEVRVQMRAAGLCHTDLAAVRDARSTPMVLGHEGTGTVESVGAGVKNLEPGTPVLLCWKTPCGACPKCSAGRPPLCEQVLDVAEPRVFWRDRPIARILNTGCFSEFVVLPARCVVPFDETLPFDQVALVGCAVATGVGAVLRTARVEAGARVAVWGAGGVGLNVVLGANLAHAATIIAVDPDPERRDLALKRGATHAVGPAEALHCVEDATSGRGLDYAFETVGDPEVMAEALSGLGVGGQLVIVGAAARDATMQFRPRAFMSNQQSITGCIYGSIYPHSDLSLFTQWLRDGTLLLEDLIGTRLTLADLPSAFESPTREGVRPVVSFA